MTESPHSTASDLYGFVEANGLQMRTFRTSVLDIKICLNCRGIDSFEWKPDARRCKMQHCSQCNHYSIVYLDEPSDKPNVRCFKITEKEQSDE